MTGSYGHTSISVRAKVPSPSDEGAPFLLAGRNGVAADRGDHGGIGKGGLRGDDAVGDVVIDGLDWISRWHGYA